MKVRVRRVSAEDVPVAITTEFIKLSGYVMPRIFEEARS